MADNQILFFLEGREVPSSRFRVTQYGELLEQRGISYRFLYTIPSKYLFYPNSIRGTPLMYPWIVLCLVWIVICRIRQIVLYTRHSSVIVLQRDLLFRIDVPFLEAFLFWWVRKKRQAQQLRLIFDVDDAIFLRRAGRSTESLTRKISFIAQRVDLVVAGNAYLKNFFEPYAPVVIIPTAVDTNRYVPKDWGDFQNQRTPVVLGWMGTKANLGYLRELEPVLLKLQDQFEFIVRIVTNADASNPFCPKVRNLELRTWSEAQEIKDLQTFDIGLMPLADDEWTKGKCGFKILQYMAVGVPSVASAVGVNPEIVQEEVTGYLAKTLADWERALGNLLADRKHLVACGRSARERVVECYARDKIFEKLFIHWVSDGEPDAATVEKL